MQYARSSRCYTEFRNTGRVPEKQEEDNMDFSEKLKQIRKSEGKPFGYSDNSYWLYFTNRGGEIDI